MADVLKPCPVCGEPPYHPIENPGGVVLIDCPNCGDMAVTSTAVAVLKATSREQTRSALLAHLIRRRYKKGERVKVTSELIEFAFSDEAKFPNALEQVENLVIWLAENVPFPGQPTDIVFEQFQAVIGCTDKATFKWVLESAISAGWLGGTHHTSKDGVVLRNGALTLAGWDWYREQGRHKHSRLAFMAMKYGDTTLEPIVETWFRPAVAQTGFELRLLRDRPAAGIIDNRMRVEIRRSRLLICDLTHGNQGAYWEAGFAEGIGIPVVYTCDESALKEAKLHFDTRNCQVVPWIAGNPSAAAEMLKATIRNTLPEEALLEDPKRSA